MKKWLVIEACEDCEDSEYKLLDSIPMVELEPGEVVARWVHHDGKVNTDGRYVKGYEWDELVEVKP